MDEPDKLRTEAPAGETRRSRDILAVFLCGDVMLGRGIDQALPFPMDPTIHESHVQSALGYVRLAEERHGPIQRPVDLEDLWGAALEEWRRVDPDVRLVNLETAVTHSNAYEPKGINYRVSPENAACLSAARIDFCSLANNHVLDWGREGLIETLQVLERLGISTSGAGRNLAEASAPAVLDVPRKGRVIITSFATATSGVPREWAATPMSPGVHLMPDLEDATVEQIAGQVKAVRRDGDVVVASIHWGPNWGYAVPDAHRRFAHALVDRAGISILHGHSSHHPIGLERYRGRLILYGCGDFLNDYEGISGYEEYRGDLSLMYFATIDVGTGGLIGLEMTPLRIRRFRLNRAPRDDAEWLRGTLDRASAPFGARVALSPDNRLILP